jgi:hypothetical protein
MPYGCHLVSLIYYSVSQKKLSEKTPEIIYFDNYVRVHCESILEYHFVIMTLYHVTFLT